MNNKNKLKLKTMILNMFIKYFSPLEVVEILNEMINYFSSHNAHILYEMIKED